MVLTMLERHRIQVKKAQEEWIQQEQAAIRSVDELAKHIQLSPKEYGNISKACQKFQMKITPYYLSLMDPENANCPIRKQSIPDIRELRVLKSELEDPIGDENQELQNHPVAALTHRYPDRVLLFPTPICGHYCRHCFRRRLAGCGDYLPSAKQIQTAIRYIRDHREIQEVILTGGDPLMLSNKQIHDLLSELKTIDHIRTLRIHTRMPVVNPYRITLELGEVLREHSPLWLVTHFNHPVEITQLAKDRLGLLADHGIPLLNQGVLLKGINDNAETLRELGWRLLEARVKPYYLHHLDRAEGLSHFRVGIRRGLNLIRELRGTMPGHAIPNYILDIPKGYGKVPLQYHYLSTDSKDRIFVETPDGDFVIYADEEENALKTPDNMPAIRPIEVYPDQPES